MGVIQPAVCVSKTHNIKPIISNYAQSSEVGRCIVDIRRKKEHTDHPGVPLDARLNSFYRTNPNLFQHLMVEGAPHRVVSCR